MSDQNNISDWIALTVTAVLDQCKNLRSESPIEHPDNDDQMWLCLSLMTRVISTFDKCIDLDDVHREFRAVIAIRALQMCLEIDDWNEHLQSVLSASRETELLARASSSLPWRAIASSYTGFLTIPRLGSEVTKNPQRCLATVEMMAYCAMAGITFHGNPINPEEPESNGVFGSTKEVTLLLFVMAELESEGRQLASRLSAFSSDPNFSRAEYLLSCLRRYGELVQMKARACAGQAGPTVSVQKSIHNFFGNGQGSDDMEEEED